MGKENMKAVAKAGGGKPSQTDATGVWAGAKNDRSDMEQEKMWRAEDDMRHVERYKEIEKDKERMGMVKKLAAEKMKNMASICGKDDK